MKISEVLEILENCDPDMEVALCVNGSEYQFDFDIYEEEMSELGLVLILDYFE